MCLPFCCLNRVKWMGKRFCGARMCGQLLFSGQPGAPPRQFVKGAAQHCAARLPESELEGSV